MPFEFLSNLNTTTTFLLLIIFILFVLAMKKILGIIKNALIIVVAAVVFPIVVNRFFGYDIPMDPDSIVSFVLLGLGTYFVYLLAKSVYSMLKIADRFAKDKIPKIERESRPVGEKEEKGEKEDKRDKKRQKELEEREKELERHEQELKWKEKVQAYKRKDWTKEYHVLDDIKNRKDEEEDEKEINVSRLVEPLPVIGQEEGEENEEDEKPKKKLKKKRKRQK